MANFIPGFDTASMVGIFARAGTPESIINKIAEAAIAASSDPTVKAKLATAGVEAAGLGPSEYAAALAAERERVAKIVTDANIRQD
jgi:tripartite-type tricarboxylate transporter receptor subunit TctC